MKSTAPAEPRKHLIAESTGHWAVMMSMLAGLRRRTGLGLLAGLLVLGAGTASAQSEDKRMWMNVGERRFAITMADTPAAKAFAAMFPLTLNMPDLNGNEKHVRLAKPLPANAIRPGTIRNGDIMLYGSDTLVVFYLTFESPYSYTRLASVDEPEALTQALGRGDARVSFSRN